MRFAILLTGLLTSPLVSWACTYLCGQVRVCELVDRAAAIVVAEVVAVSPNETDEYVRAQMKVVRVFKSNPALGETFERKSWANGTRVGQQWLISFAQHQNTGKIWPAADCTDGLVTNRSAELGYLEAWAAGDLGEWRSQLAVDVGSPGITVLADSPEDRFRAVSANGVAFFNGIPPGKYTIRAYGDGYAPLDPYDYDEVEVQPNSCALGRVSLATTNRVSGVVLGPAGEPLSDVSVALIPLDADGGSVWSSPNTPKTGAAGEFAFEHIRPGRYVLGTQPGERPFPATLYPATEVFGEAGVIELGPGDLREGLEIRVARTLRPRVARVRALFGDGQPAIGASLGKLARWEFADSGERWEFSGVFPATRTDAEGWATLSLFEDVNYRLRVMWSDMRSGDARPAMAESEIVEIAAGSETVERVVRLRRYEMGLCGAKSFLE